jgi:hypothetical protein
MNGSSAPREVKPESAGASHRPSGPHPGILAAVSLLLLLTGLVLTAVLSGGQQFVSPFAPSETVATFFRDNPVAVRVGSMLQFGSAVPLGIYAATVYALQLRLGVRVPGPAIAFFGGITASLMLMVSAMLVWVVSRPEISTDAVLTHALTFLAFITGGVGFATGLGLLVAGMAVPFLVLRLAPGWFAWAGLVLAAAAELSFLSMTIEPLQFLLPVARFGGLAWLVAAGFLLPRTRAAANQAVTRARR